MRKKLLALADKEFLNGNRAGAIAAIETFYALVDAEERAHTLLRQRETAYLGESSLHLKKNFPDIVVDLGHCEMFWANQMYRSPQSI